MNVSGLVRFAVNENGDKTWIVDYIANSVVLQEHLKEFVGTEVTDLIDINEVKKKKPNINNCLLLVTFLFKGFSTFNGEHEEFDETITVRDVIMLSSNYKEVWRSNLTDLYGFSSVEDLIANQCIEEISEWENFYNEDYTHAK